LRDWLPRDVAAFAAWQAPHHSWHDTNGPYFGRPTEDQARAAGEARAVEAAVDVAARPTPRTSLAIVGLDDAMVGSVSWTFESAATDWRRMGISIYEPACRGLGIGREALALWTTYLFATTSARRLDVATYSGNTAMCAVGRALGFTLEARFREARPWAGEVFDGLVFGVLRGEWEARASTTSPRTP
jgi:RimJ/RimL family protein N-acetyltransferase